MAVHSLNCAVWIALVIAAMAVGKATAQPPAVDPALQMRQRQFDESLGVLKHLDGNRNGTLEPDEVVGGKSHSHEEMFRGVMQKAGLPPTTPVAFNVVRDRLAAYHQVPVPGVPATSGAATSSVAPSGLLQMSFGPLGYTGAASGTGGAATSVAIGPPTGSAADRQRLFAQCLETLKHLDANRNEIIDPDEPTGGKSHDHKQMYVDVMQKAGLPANTPANISIIRDRLAAVLQIAAPAGPAMPAATTASIMPGGEPLVRGFGVATAPPAVSGFGPSPAATTAQPAVGPPGSKPATPPASGANSEAERKVDEWVARTFKEQDANRNGRLEKEEWKGMRGDPAAVDANHDGVITQEELRARLLQFVKEGGHKPKDAARESSKPPYTIASTPRLPKGLPDWFLKKDADSDGQVSMAEYASAWTDALAAEFVRLDANHDGVITPNECLQGLKK